MLGQKYIFLEEFSALAYEKGGEWCISPPSFPGGWGGGVVGNGVLRGDLQMVPTCPCAPHPLSWGAYPPLEPSTHPSVLLGLGGNSPSSAHPLPQYGKKKQKNPYKLPQILEGAEGGGIPPSKGRPSKGEGDFSVPTPGCRGGDFRRPQEPSKSKFKAKEPERVPSVPPTALALSLRSGFCRDAASGTPSRGFDLALKAELEKAAMGRGGGVGWG